MEPKENPILPESFHGNVGVGSSVHEIVSGDSGGEFSYGASRKEIDPLADQIGDTLMQEFDPMLLLESAGSKSCCIFNVPDSLSEANPNAYTPKIVSIGPYHYGEKKHRMVQEHKLRFLQLFINKARDYGMKDSSVMYETLSTMIVDIRKSYSMHLRFDDDKLISMMILDGIFILTLILIKSKIIEIDEDVDPIFTSSWILPSIRIDLLLLENQVPFFILEILFETSCIPGTLIYLAFDFFNLSLCYGENYWRGYDNLKPKHLLDLLRETFLPRKNVSVILSPSSCHNCLGSCLYCRRSSGYTSQIISSAAKHRLKDSSSRLILSAKKLRLKGIHIKLRSDADSMLDIKIKDNNVLIPMLRIDRFVSSFFLNCVAFEQLYNDRSTHITSYVVFMGNLLHNQEDADFLSNHNRIIENYLGDENDVCQFFKTITKAVVFNLEKSYLKDVYEGVNDYTSRYYSGWWSEFKHTHFESPWTLLSSGAVLLVILLTGLQVLFAVLSYRHDTRDTK